MSTNFLFKFRHETKFLESTFIQFCNDSLLRSARILRQVFLFRVPNLVEIFINYFANLENLVANLLGNLEIFQEDLKISFASFRMNFF